MGAVASLSRDATVVGLDVAQISVFLFGFLFLIGWIAEETTKEHRWKKYTTGFVVMAIVGVAGEWLADIAVFALSEHLQTISDREVSKLKLDEQTLAIEQDKARKALAEAQRDASNARSIAAQAEGHLAEANARAAQASAKAEQFRLAIADAQKDAANARLETEMLRAKVAPRNLTAEQQKAIASDLASLNPGVETEVLTMPPVTFESANFATQLGSALSGWHAEVSAITGIAYCEQQGIVSGTMVVTTADPESKRCGEALLKALRRQQVVAFMAPKTMAGCESQPEAAAKHDRFCSRINVCVGNHP